MFSLLSQEMAGINLQIGEYFPKWKNLPIYFFHFAIYTTVIWEYFIEL
jgi:hypothetical protein